MVVVPSRFRAPRLLALAAGLAALAGCTSSGSSCSANDDCPPQTVCRGGQCVGEDEDPHGTQDAGHVEHTDAGAPDASDASVPDGGTPDASTSDASTSSGGCAFNDDGILTAEELPLALNVETRFVAASADGGAGIPVDLAGTTDGNGMVTWDFSGALSGDHPVTIEALPLTDLWFGPHFPDDAYAIPLDAASTNYAVYQRSPGKVQLLGVASDEPDVTLLQYEPAVDIVRFPIALDQTFSTTTDVSGTFEGNVFFTSTDTYEITVDARGTLLTPAGSFPVLRVRSVHDVDVPIAVWPFVLTYRYISYSFMTACYSQVAYVASFEDEEELLFTSAAELRRLGLMP